MHACTHRHTHVAFACFCMGFGCDAWVCVRLGIQDSLWFWRAGCFGPGFVELGLTWQNKLLKFQSRSKWELAHLHWWPWHGRTADTPETATSCSDLNCSLNLSLTGLPLQAANNSGIATFEECSLTLNLGLRRILRQVVIIADVMHAILGADFLSHFQLLVDVNHCQLVNTTTRLQVHRIGYLGYAHVKHSGSR